MVRALGLVRFKFAPQMLTRLAMGSTYGFCSQINQLRWTGACYVVGLAIGCEFGSPSHVVWQLSLVRLVHVGGLLSTGYALCLASVEPPSLIDCVCITDPSPFRQVALGSHGHIPLPGPVGLTVQ